MSKNKKYHQLYDRLLEEVEMLHERIKVGIRQGLKMLVIVPLLFMLIMFLTQGSKGIFLVLWIVSTFVIAAFLIALEYVDHGIQKRLEEITGMENALPEDSIMPEIPDIDIEELRLIAQERRSQLPLHKLKEKLAAEEAHTEAEEVSEAEPPKDEEPIVEAPVIAAAAAEEKAAEAEEAEPIVVSTIIVEEAAAAEETEPTGEAPFVIEKNAEAEDNDAPFIFEESAKMNPEDEDAETPFTFDESAKAESGSSKSEKEDAEDVVKV